MVEETLKGGKGDDKINPIQYVYNSDGSVDVTSTQWVIDPFAGTADAQDFNGGNAKRTW